MEKKPNIIIVMTDQQRWDLRKSRGYELDTMPFIDQWAKGGVDFDRAYTPNPTCMPARVSMFTGRYSQCHQVRTNHNAVDALYTEDLMDVLKSCGYRMALCGKNHSHRKNEEFDYYETCGHLGNEGEINTTPAQKEFAKFLIDTKHMETHVPSPQGVEVQHPYRNVSSIFRFIDETEENQPFFAWLSFAEPHNPYQVPEPYFNMFPPESLPELAAGAADLEGKGPRFVWLRKVWEQVLGSDIDKRILRARSNYHGMLRLIDDQFKRLITGLRERDLEKDTIVIFVSDHGDFAGEYGLIRKGPDLPDGLAHIPMIWRGPGIPAHGRRNTEFVNLIDVLPTICNLLEVDIPLGCQGKSLLPVLKDEEIPKQEFDTAYAESGYSGLFWNEADELTLPQEGAVPKNWEAFDCLNTWTQCGQVRALWKGDYHIQLNMMGEGYLYNLKNDPHECRNLWEDGDSQGIKTELLIQLSAAMMKASDPLPVPHNRYRTKLHPKGYWNQSYISPDTGVRPMKAIGSRGNI
ncbi:sulfatase-like hydrolase/transferase [Lacrimispora indolis]|uniref:sulfatase-like hydrolase/transferase n=1 Tax=Lacrimispora indolis TaxID=69825 RepID=UPI000400D6D6|nr:sulfatase-like hydrolase/transferase [[Clostridium] methoxybenzovorans]